MLAPSVGTKVGFVNLPKGQGAYSEYVTASAIRSVFPMPSDLPVERAASFFVNPYTVVGFLDTAERLGCRALVHTAAASQVGQMLVKLAAQRGFTIINVVRKDSQVALLRALGAKIVVNSSVDGWEEELRGLVEKHKAKIVFDAVAGSMTGALLALLPPKSTYFVYGRLARS